MKNILLLLCLLLSAQNILSQENSTTLYVGTSKINITPKESVHLAGYSGMTSDRVSEIVHDSLYCRVTVFKTENKRLVLISSDLVQFFGRYDTIKTRLMNEFNFQSDELFLSSIHTHSGPVTTLREKYNKTSNYRYTQELIELIVENVGNALNNMVPADLTINSGYSPIGINRRVLKLDNTEWPNDGGLIKMGRNPQGIVDNEVLVLKINGIESETIACLYDYACHSRSQHYGSKVISGDIFGISEQIVEQIIGNGIVASAFAGASSEIDPLYVLGGFNDEPNWVPETELMGRLLGQEVITSYRKAKQKVNTSDIQSELHTIMLPCKKRDEYITDESLAKKGMNITIASIGEIAFIGFSGELSVEIGLEIKAASPYKYNFIITHCNGGSGYLSPKEFYKERGYEVTYSPFGPEAADLVIKKTLSMLYNQYNSN